jgi:Protein of unknown function (DUF2567)
VGEPWEPMTPDDPSSDPIAVEPAIAPREPWVTRADLIFAAQVVIALLVVGVLIGLLWRVWATTPTRGLAYYNNTIVPDETEGFISSDGRFVVMTGLVGLIAGGLVWLRRSRRGPVAAGALAVGTVAGAALTDLVGGLVGGGSTAGKLGTQLPRLPLEVHATGLLFVQGTLALLVYVLCTLFAARDDLGVEDEPDIPSGYPVFSPMPSV